MQRFELIEGSSSKFWEVETRAALLVVRYGRIGTAGQTKEKSFPTAAAAEAERAKLVREKTGKGYREVGGGSVKAAPGKASAAPAKAAARGSAKPASKGTKATAELPVSAAPPASAKRVQLMPVPGASDTKPGSFAFTAELDGLFTRGWPYLRVLDDAPITPVAARKQAIAALEAIDPHLPTIVPREVARRMLLGYLHHPFREGDAMRAAVDGDRCVDASLLADVLKDGVRKETYVFRMQEVVFLLEAFLGTEPVLEALAARCRHALENVSAWGKTKFEIDHENSHWRRIVHAMGWLRLRVAPGTWSALVAPLRRANPKLPRHSGTLARLADDSIPVGDDEYALDFAAQRRDAAAVRACVESPRPQWVSAQHVFVLGADHLLENDVRGLPRDPKWFQQRRVVEIGAIRAPGTLRTIGALLASRSAGPQAARWLEDHRAWALDEALPVLEKRGRDAAIVTAVRASLGGAAPPAAVDSKTLKRELSEMLASVPAALAACDGVPAKELEVLRAAFDRYCEIQAALGEVTPEAYFTHAFIDAEWGTSDRATIDRWIDLAVDAASG